MFSSERVRNKIQTLLWKFTDCYKLYSVKRPLYKHEMALLAVRCASLGSWMPVSFPDESIIRKFHVLTYHIPQKARKRRSVGIEAQHCSEAIHPVINELDRKYHCVQHKRKKLECIAKSQWLKSNRSLKNFREPSGSCKSKKGKK